MYVCKYMGVCMYVWDYVCMDLYARLCMCAFMYVWVSLELLEGNVIAHFFTAPQFILPPGHGQLS